MHGKIFQIKIEVVDRLSVLPPPRKLYVQSEPYDEELTCMGLFRRESKLVVGSSKGRMYTFNWDEFGLHSNMFPGTQIRNIKRIFLT